VGQRINRGVVASATMTPPIGTSPPPPSPRAVMEPVSLPPDSEPKPARCF